MSLVLMFIYWVAIPVFALYAGRGLLRRARKPYARVLLKFIGATLFLGWFWLILGKQLWLDHQVRELCAKDGGIRVYETVTLPAERFDKWGNVGIPHKKYAKPTDAYYYESEDHNNQEGNPALLQSKYRIIRRTDGKVLGELTRYGHGGGGLPGPWHGTSFSCPPIGAPGTNLETSIFLKGNEK